MKDLSMKRAGLLVFLISILFNTSSARAVDDAATLSTDVLEYINLDITAGSTVNFGDLTPGAPVAAPATGTIASVTTTAADGYTLSLSDGSDSNSSMRHTDTTTYIADYAGTITTPTAWTGTGVGVNLFAADSNYESKWCADVCTTYNDADNKYAGIPAAATITHTVTGYHASANTSSWAFKIDVPNNQKTGTYSGDVTFTATGVL